MLAVVVVLSLVLVVAFASTGIPKILAQPKMLATAEHLGVPANLFRLIGGLEVLAALGLLLGIFAHWLSALTLICLVLLMIGALVAHARVKDQGNAMMPALGLGVVALVTLILWIPA